MSIWEELREGNERFRSERWDPSEADLQSPPAKGLAIVACMDARYSVERVLGLQHGDAMVIRNAGNVLDDGTLRSVLVAVHLLGVTRVAVMGHTKCGMLRVGRGEFRIAHSIADRTGVPLHEAMRPDFQRWLGGFSDVDEHVRRSMEVLRHHPYMPRDLEIAGLVYDNDKGSVRSVA